MPPWRGRPQLRPTQVIVLSFLLAASAGGLLLMLPAASEGEPFAPIDALFTAVTSVCVTGLVVVNTGADLTPFGQIVVLCLIQIGGLGYMVISTAFMALMGQRVQLRRRILLSEAMGEVGLGNVPNLFRTAITFTFGAEFIGFVLLTLAFRRYQMPWPVAAELGVFHSVSAFCNAGLDLFGRPEYAVHFPPGAGSLTQFVGDPYVSGIVMALIVFGGLGFVVVLDLLHSTRSRRLQLALHTKIALSSTLVLVLGGTLVYLLLEATNPNTLGPFGWPFKIWNALFQSVTTRTAGFNTIDQNALFPASKLFTTVLMFIGASPGGTGGGVKTTTFVVILLAAFASVRGDDDITAFKRRISHGSIYRALAVVVASALVVVLLTFSFGVMEYGAMTGAEPDDSAVAVASQQMLQHQFMEYFFEATSAFGTVGLSTGITPLLSDGSKLAVILTMMLGRVGPVTLAMALAERRRRYPARHPLEQVMIG